MYAFANETAARVLIGSGNLTEGGLYTNYEAGAVIALDLRAPADKETFLQIEQFLDACCDPTKGTAKRLDVDLLDQLSRLGYLPPEVYTRDTEEGGGGELEQATTLFSAVAVPPAPSQSRPVVHIGGRPETEPTTFFMTLQYVDLSRGQLTPGAQERSPEIYIPLVARNAAPGFWDWDAGFTEDATNPNKFDRAVRMLIGTSVEDVTMTYFPHKHEFRIRNRALQNTGARPNDIIRIEKTNYAVGYDYHVTIIPQGTSQYATAQAVCINRVRNSPKLWGYL